MKKMMNALSILLMMFAFGFSSITACAGEISQSEVTTYTEVKISATVPEGFNEDIIITLEESVTLVRGGVVLSAENGYASSTRVIGGNIYNTYVRYGNNGDWKCDIAKQYEVPNGVSVEFSITVTDGSLANKVLTEEQPEQSQPVSGNAETPHSKDIDPLTNLLKGEVAVQNFIDKTSFIQNDESYQGWDFLGLYSGDGLKKDYLDSHSNNTEEQWNAMTEYEKFVWRKVYLSPNLYMFKAKDLNDFMEDVLATEISLFKNNEYTDEDTVYDALVELYEWHYSYFLVTGTVYDYYNGAEYVLDEEVQEVVILEEVKQPEEIKQLEELKEEVMAELTEEEKEELRIATSTKTSPILPITIVVLCIIIAVIAFLFIRKQKK